MRDDDPQVEHVRMMQVLNPYPMRQERPPDHHATLSPSRFPALAHCIHYAPVPFDSAARSRGTKIHEYFARFLSGTVSGWPKEDIEYASKGEWLANETRELLPDLRGVEHKVSIFNYAEIPPEEVTFGTCDAWGYADGFLGLVDAKSGLRRDYREQMAVYALGLMEDQGTDNCFVSILYCDLEDRDTYAFDKQEAEEIVFGIIARVNAGMEPPKENSHCGFCSKQLTCPAWTFPARQALDIVTEKTFDLESLKADPIRLGEFLIKWSKAEKLVEAAKLKDAAKEFLAADKKSVPGWAVQVVNGRRSYSESEIEEIIELIPELGMDRARSFVSVNIEAFQRAWESFSRNPIPVIPSEHAGTYTKLIRKK